MVKYTHQLKLIPRIILMGFAVCFLIGGLQHWLDILNGGLFPYHSIPFVLNIFLTSLAVVDIVAAIMLIIAPIAGLYFAMLIMAADMFVDIYANSYYWHISVLQNPRLLLIIMFSLLLFISGPLLIKWFKSNRNIEV